MAVISSTLNNIRAMSNYGFYISGNTTDPIYSKGWISNKPNLSIQGSSLYIDYSHAYDTSDISYLIKLFGTTGTTYSFSSTEYYDDVKKKRTFVGGVFQLTENLNGKRIIVGNVISGFTSTTDYNYYAKENFITVPQYSTQAPGSYTGYFLYNSFPDLSLNTFKNLGIMGNLLGYEEYAEISSGSGLNEGRIQIENICTLKDGQEVLYFVSGGTAQDFRSSKTALNIYMRGDTDALVSPRLSNLTGIFVTRKKTDNTLINCSEYQSENQSTLRKEYLLTNNVDAYGTFLNCKSCFDLLYGEGSSVTIYNVGDAFNTLLFLKIINSSTVNVVNSLVGSFTQSTSVINTLNGNDNIIKIDLSHPSLLKYDLAIYTEPTRKILIPTNQFVKYGEIGYNNSFAMLKNYVKNSTLYCTLTGTSTIYFTINV